VSTSADIVIPDLSDPASFVDGVPFDAFARLRESPGLYWQPTDVSTTHGGFWAVTRFTDIREVEKQVPLFTSTHGANYPMMTTEPASGPAGDVLMRTDPPRHTHLRRAAAAGFAPRVVANFEPWVRQIVDEVINDVAGLEEFDFVQKFARTIPAYVIGRVLGVRPEDREKQVEWTLRIFAATQEIVGHDSIARVEEAKSSLIDYAMELQKVKRANPGDDMCTELTALVDDGTLTPVEFGQWMMLMMSAGFETTHTAIGQAMRMYLENSDVQEKVDRAIAHGEGELVAKEFIRMISPAMQMARTASEDTQVAGTDIRKGDVMVLYFISGCRDGSVFADPDVFNPWREEKVTLAFGSGVHRCIGAYLATLEVQVLFEQLAAKNLKLRLNGTPKRGWSNFINQLQELPVARLG